MHVVFSLETGGLENGVVNLCNRLDRDLFATSVCVFRGGVPWSPAWIRRSELLAKRF